MPDNHDERRRALMQIRVVGYVVNALGMAAAVYGESRVLAVSVIVVGAAVIVGGRVYLIRRYGPRA